MAILRALARRGDVNAKNEYGVTALFTAVFKNNYLAADILLQMGAEVEVRTLISAILQDRTRLLKLLLVEGLQVDVNAVDSLGFSALAYAVNARNIHIIEILLAHGAEADARVWRLAARQGWEEVQSVLLRHFPPK